MQKIRIYFEKLNFSLSLSAALLSMAFVPNFFKEVYWGALVYSCVFVIYGLHRFIKYKKQQLSVDSFYWHSKNQSVIIFLLILHLLFAILLSVFYLQIEWNNSMIVVAILTSTYLVPDFRLTIRRIPFMKAIIIAYVWTYVLIISPSFIVDDYYIDNYLSSGFFFFFIHLAVLSDIKDITIDPMQWKTIPSILGADSTKFIALICILFTFLLFSFSTFTTYIWIIAVGYFVFWYFLEKKYSQKNVPYDQLIWSLTLSFFLCKYM